MGIIIAIIGTIKEIINIIINKANGKEKDKGN